MGVFKGSLYILNFLCGLLPCEHKYPYPDTSSEPQALTLRVISDLNETISGSQNQTDKNDEEEMENSLVVVTASGKMKGYWMRAVGGRKIRAFEGIPYATAPIDELRFKAPLPVKPWTGMLQADLKGPKCLQFNDIKLKRVIGSENCLFLNIYTKKPSSRKYPVIIYIHGGGSGNDFGPAYLLMRDLVLVTLNYRLGVMGFLSTGDESSPGNFGLKDQAEAIIWIHANIDKFGGDSNRIILLGHGSGASAIHFHMMSFKARGKFVGAISISGTAFNPWALHTKTDAHNLTKAFAKYLHCPIHGTNGDIVKCLRKQKGYDLVKIQIQFLDKWPVSLSLFRPVVEEEYQKEEPFISETPEEAYRKGTVDKIPWICGQAEDEGYTFLLPHVAQGSFAELRKKWNEIAPDFFNYDNLPVDQDEITRRLNWLYFRHASPQTAPLKIYSDALGARLIHTGIHKGLQAHCRHAETYAFVFGFSSGKYNLATAAGIKPTDWAVGHGEILGYILNSTDTYPGFKKNDSELVLSKILVNVIYNFADKQKPGFTTTDGEDFHLWDRVMDPRNISFLRIDKNIKMIPEPYLQQTLYWESLGLPDSLPLANFSNEIDDIIEKDPKTKGFVSTVVTKQKESEIPPPELRPPPEDFKDNYFVTYGNVTFDNKTEPGVSFKIELGKDFDITKISLTTEPPPEVSTATTPATTTSTTSTTTTTTTPPPPTPTTPSTTPPPPPQTTNSTSSPRFTRWFAQDYHVPNVPEVMRQQAYTTTSSTKRPPTIPPPLPSRTMEPPIMPPPLPSRTMTPPTIPPLSPPRTVRPGNRGVLVGNLIDTVLRQNPLVGPYDKFQNSSRGVSVPVVGDYDPHQNFVTRSNINMTVAYLKSIGNKMKEMSSKSNGSTNNNVDEMMLMDSNSI